VTATQIASSTLTATPVSFSIPEEPSALLTETPTVGPCGFMWANQSLPELSEQFNVKLKDAGLPVESAYADAYGENCLYADGSIAYFAARETDYYVTLNVSSLDDKTALGGLLEQVLAVIDTFLVGTTPGPNPGYIGVNFQAGDQVEHLWFERRVADETRQQGLTGAELYQALIVK
jgi:hypothetical protein